MKIITWNCNGSLRSKFKQLEHADIYIIQECEDPSQTKDVEYAEFATNHIWTGHSKNKGLGIFAREDILLENNNWDAHGLEHFISCKINDTFDLIGVWACNNYVEEWYEYQQMYKDRFNGYTIIIGDFNSNAKFEKNGKNRSHTNFVNQLREKGIESVYHYQYEENHGEETLPTFYHLKKQMRPHHIDYCFMNNRQLQNIYIGSYEEWIAYSDHMPMIVEIK